MNPSSRQSGNVIFIIVIMIGLFAALSFAVNQAMKGGSMSGVNAQKMDVMTTDILTFANNLSTTVKTLILSNGCTDTQLSFESPLNSGYINAGAPVDKSCNVFDKAGGGMTYLKPPLEILDASLSSDPEYGDWRIVGRYCILDVGTGGSSCTSANTELLLLLPAVKKELCDALQSKIGMSNFYPGNGATAGKFTGSYGSAAMMSVNTNTSGRKILCYQNAGRYTLVYTLLER